jgi:hypothetical protein
MIVVLFYYYYYSGETAFLGTAATTGLFYQPQMVGHGDCGEIVGMKIGRETEVL